MSSSVGFEVSMKFGQLMKSDNYSGLQHSKEHTGLMMFDNY
jgi:hypothetical protein